MKKASKKTTQKKSKPLTQKPKVLVRFFYIPCPNQETAIRIAETLVAQKQIACANVIPGIMSLYPWKGQIERATECLLIIKTSLPQKKLNSLQDKIAQLHPYEIPCIAEIDLGSLNSAYSLWIQENVQN